MDELFFNFVIGASLIIVGAIWIKLILDNAKQEKRIQAYLKDLSTGRIEKQGT